MSSTNPPSYTAQQISARAKGSSGGSTPKNPPPPGGYTPPPWPQMAANGFHGLAGEVVSRLSPHTEADPVALLLQFLASFGNVIGRGSYYRIEANNHFGNLFIVLAGDTAKARKGTSAGHIRALFERVDPVWAAECIKSGMSSGEGVISAVRDPVMGLRKGVLEVVDTGVSDKRLLLLEPEFCQVFAVLKREGSTLSSVVRDAWDARELLATLTKHSPTRATGALISIVGHITIGELRRMLDETQLANGFANRFLFACVKRNKYLPFGGEVPAAELDALQKAIEETLATARDGIALTMTAHAQAKWIGEYPRLSGSGTDLVAHMTSRSETQTLRLALLFALLDRSATINLCHLEAGLAVWAFCEDSARYLFNDMLGVHAADTILAALRQIAPNGLAKTDIFALFGRHLKAGDINAALGALLVAHKIERRSVPSGGGQGGRPREMWFAR